MELQPQIGAQQLHPDGSWISHWWTRDEDFDGLSTDRFIGISIYPSIESNLI